MEALASVNWWAILLSTFIAMAVGSVWYSQVLFGGIWQRELGMKLRDMGGSDPNAAMVGAALLTLMQATILAVLIGGGEVPQGVGMGALVSLGFVVTSLGVQYCFEARSLPLFAINAGYIVVSMMSMGAIIGAWH